MACASAVVMERGRRGHRVLRSSRHPARGQTRQLCSREGRKLDSSHFRDLVIGYQVGNYPYRFHRTTFVLCCFRQLSILFFLIAILRKCKFPIG